MAFGLPGDRWLPSRVLRLKFHVNVELQSCSADIIALRFIGRTGKNRIGQRGCVTNPFHIVITQVDGCVFRRLEIDLETESFRETLGDSLTSTEACASHAVLKKVPAIKISVVFCVVLMRCLNIKNLHVLICLFSDIVKCLWLLS